VAGYGNPTSFNYGAGGYGSGAIEYGVVTLIQNGAMKLRAIAIVHLRQRPGHTCPHANS
jgi:hypothetical protein